MIGGIYFEVYLEVCRRHPVGDSDGDLTDLAANRRGLQQPPTGPMRAIQDFDGEAGPAALCRLKDVLVLVVDSPLYGEAAAAGRPDLGPYLQHRCPAP